MRGQTELCQEKPGSSVQEGRWGTNTRGQQVWWNLSKENPSKQELGASSWEDPGRCAQGTLSSDLSSKDVVRGLGNESEGVDTIGKPSVKPHKKPLPLRFLGSE